MANMFWNYLLKCFNNFVLGIKWFLNDDDTEWKAVVHIGQRGRISRTLDGESSLFSLSLSDGLLIYR